ncbi:MAG TPA: hypothetical protein VMU57_11320 [Edaphobacter sp.]|uniref:hypothetical protein n=1 Tax=Edaphobacter sp. TaxID=1934404 RepID=UPI002C08223B|nr:hypothetical protein [Edaphobacter sp.]HUZ95493.1 hypothetical protein [Edaphobacter sp.]
MANLQITDALGLIATIEIRDDSPLAKAKITQISSLTQALRDEFTKPVDQTSLKGFSFGADCSTPNAAIDNVAKLTVGAGVCGEISIIRPVDKTLFPSDTFSPDIKIAPDQCWVGVGFDVSVDANAQASVDGFGAGVQDISKCDLTTYTLIEASAGKFPILIDALKAALDGFYLAATVDAVRGQPTGSVCANEISGTVTFTGSYELPVSINALASADLPLNYKITVQPEATLQLSGSIALSGDMIVRSHKIGENLLEIGVYKKRGSTLTANFTARAGVGVDEGTTDLVSIFLSTAFPGVSCKGAGIAGDTAKSLNSALNDCVDRSLSVAMNICCSAESTDEAAVIYQIDLTAGDTDATDAALKDALKGNWTGLSQLGNAKLSRNIVTDSREYKHTISMNLLGFYNAAQVDSYVQSCTILCDPYGHVVVTDKSDASRVSVAATPYAADPDKLRRALAQDFLVTAAYAAVAANAPITIQASAGSGSEVQPILTMQQSYVFYKDSATRQDMQDQILLGVALKLIDEGQKTQYWEGTLAASRVFPHAHVSASARYDNDGVLGLFFADPGQRIPRNRPEIERAGRNAMIALLDPGDTAGPERLAALQNDAIWNAMDVNGNVAAFKTIPELSQLSVTTLGDVGVDWTAISWWADAMSKTALKLKDLLAFLETIPGDDFSHNPEFIAKTNAFQNMLGSFVKNTHDDFVNGWGIAVVFALAGSASQREMDISWDHVLKHYQSNS